MSGSTAERYFAEGFSPFAKLFHSAFTVSEATTLSSIRPWIPLSTFLSHSYTFEYNHKILPHKIFETDPSTAKSLFILYGEEYSAQYIAADPINEDLNLVNKVIYEKYGTISHFN